MFLFSLNKKQLLVSLIIASTATIGDINSELKSNPLAAALCDNITHALIGALTWIGTFIAKTNKIDWSFIFEIFICAVCSSVIDLDHFITAKSFYLKDATSLRNRPFMHCTTLLAIIASVIFLTARFYKITWLYKLGWIFTVAFVSHHIRDSKRRGFWIWPFGHTVPTPFLCYICSQIFLPQIMSAIIYKLSPELLRNEFVTSIETV